VPRSWFGRHSIADRNVLSQSAISCAKHADDFSCFRSFWLRPADRLQADSASHCLARTCSTKKHKPWHMHGFPTWSAALHFQHAWQHDYTAPATKEYRKKHLHHQYRGTQGSIRRRLFEHYAMLNLLEWSSEQFTTTKSSRVPTASMLQRTCRGIYTKRRAFHRRTSIDRMQRTWSNLPSLQKRELPVGIPCQLAGQPLGGWWRRRGPHLRQARGGICLIARDLKWSLLPV